MRIKHFLAVTAACVLCSGSMIAVPADAENETSTESGVSSTETGDTDILPAIAALALAGAAAGVSKKKN